MCAGAIYSTLFLLQALQKRQLGFLISLYLLGPEFAPTGHACSYFDCHTVSLYFVPGGEVCPGKALQHCKEGSQVPTGLICFVGYSQYLHFFTSNGSLNLLCALLYGNPYKGHVLFFFLPSEPRRVAATKTKEKKKHQGFVKRVSGG